MSRTLSRSHALRRPGARLTPAGARLRRGAAIASAVLLAALLGAVSLLTLNAGGTGADLGAPAAGALLAFTAEMLCLDIAIRHVERLADRRESAKPATAPSPVRA